MRLRAFNNLKLEAMLYCIELKSGTIVESEKPIGRDSNFVKEGKIRPASYNGLAVSAKNIDFSPSDVICRWEEE